MFPLQVSFKPLRILTPGFGLYSPNILFLFQLTNFSLVPIQWRTAYTGLYGFLWATFLCYSQQSGDGTLTSVFTFLHRKASKFEKPPEKWGVKDSLKVTIFFFKCSELPTDKILYLPAVCAPFGRITIPRSTCFLITNKHFKFYSYLFSSF